MKHFLVGVDGSTPSHQAFQYALTVINPAIAELSLVGAVHSPMIVMADPEERGALIQAEQARLTELVEGMREDAVKRGIQTHALVTVGEPLGVLLNYAHRERVDHIVVGHRSKSPLAQLMIGSVAKGIVDGAPCTVTVIR